MIADLRSAGGERVIAALRSAGKERVIADVRSAGEEKISVVKIGCRKIVIADSRSAGGERVIADLRSAGGAAAHLRWAFARPPGASRNYYGQEGELSIDLKTFRSPQNSKKNIGKTFNPDTGKIE